MLNVIEAGEDYQDQTNWQSLVFAYLNENPVGVSILYSSG